MWKKCTHWSKSVYKQQIVINLTSFRNSDASLLDSGFFSNVLIYEANIKIRNSADASGDSGTDCTATPSSD